MSTDSVATAIGRLVAAMEDQANYPATVISFNSVTYRAGVRLEPDGALWSDVPVEVPGDGFCPPVVPGETRVVRMHRGVPISVGGMIYTRRTAVPDAGALTLHEDLAVLGQIVAAGPLIPGACEVLPSGSAAARGALVVLRANPDAVAGSTGSQDKLYWLAQNHDGTQSWVLIGQGG